MKTQGKAIILSAPSGSGKSTLVNYLLTLDLPVEFSVSATTRLPRGTEKHGKEYFFYSEEEFKELIANNKLFEWEEVYEGRFYGTLRSELERIWAMNKAVIFDVDVAGGMKLKEKFGNDSLSIFILPPSIEELKNRLLHRSTDDLSEIEKRIKKAEQEIVFKEKFDNIIVNDVLESAKKELEHTVIKFLH
ncbi:MAG: guanylate kinase [Endomicrobiia bacterium]